MSTRFSPDVVLARDEMDLDWLFKKAKRYLTWDQRNFDTFVVSHDSLIKATKLSHSNSVNIRNVEKHANKYGLTVTYHPHCVDLSLVE